MSTITVQVQIPEALRQLGLSDEDIRREVPVLLVLQRFRQGVISSGKAAQLLGLSRRDFLDLLARERLPVYDPDVQELADELKILERLESDVEIPPGIQRSKEAFLRDLPELLANPPPSSPDRLRVDQSDVTRARETPGAPTREPSGG